MKVFSEENTSSTATYLKMSIARVLKFQAISICISVLTVKYIPRTPIWLEILDNLHLGLPNTNKLPQINVRFQLLIKNNIPCKGIIGL